jgi:hypothetical protein
LPVDKAVVLVGTHANQTAVGLKYVAQGKVNFADRNLKAWLHFDIQVVRVKQVALAR